jgi:zinc protease
VRITFTGPFEWTDENRYALTSLASLLRIKMRENLREEKGGTYGVGVWGTPQRWPVEQYSFGVTFGCSPDRVDELTLTAFDVLDSIRTFGPSAADVEKVQEAQRREHETELQQNRAWLNWLQYYFTNDENPDRILEMDRLTETLTPRLLQHAAQVYLNKQNYVRIALYPQAG